MSPLAALSLFLVITSGLSHPEKDGPNIHPKYLDHLLDTEQYELFAEIMNIPDVNFVRPKEGERNENPMFNKGLEMGDIMPVFGRLKEESRQNILMDYYPSYKWPNREIPVYIKESDFTPEQVDVILDAIHCWNKEIRCVKIVLWKEHHTDYLYVISGSGCWSYLGRIGGKQILSLQADGCVYKGTVLHEFQHAAGFHHEQTRLDRDYYVRILWKNIPDEWKSQYEKTNPNYFGLLAHYDFCSIMHYPLKAPGTNKDAIEVLKDASEIKCIIGKGNNFTLTDIKKINLLYCDKCE